MVNHKMTWVSAWVATLDDEGRGYPTLRGILDDMSLAELEHISDVAMNLDRQARRVWTRKLADSDCTGEETNE